MNFALFRCCPTSIFLNQYELSTDALLKKLDVGVEDVKEFGCCGYPLKNSNFKAYLLSSARNMALAETRDLNLLTVCNCCYGSLKHAHHTLMKEVSLREEINKTLGKEGLEFKGNIEIKHLLEFLFQDLGVEALKKKIVKPFKDLKIATHYGCHILRPRHFVRFDKATDPVKFDQLVEATGAQSVQWQSKLECCGSPMWGVDDDLSMDLTFTKINDALASDADYFCVTCVYCQLQFDRVQEKMIQRRETMPQLPSILYTQMLGLSLGIDPKDLGLNQNRLDISGIMNYM